MPLLKEKKGIVLLMTFVFMITLTIIVSAFLYMTSVQLRTTEYEVSSSKALWLAEAGIQQVLYNLKTYSAYRNAPTTVNGNLGAGSYSTSVPSVVKAPPITTYTLVSTGTVKTLNRKITQTVVVNETGGGSYPGGLPDAFNYTGYIRINANLSNTTNGVINGDFKVDQNVSGEGAWTINGALIQNSSLTIPTVDFAGYKGIANNVVNGNFTFQAGHTYTGTYYVTGVATIEDSVTINGGLVSEGTVNMRGADGVKLNPSDGMPAIITQGNIDMANSANSKVTGKGVVYAQQGLNLQQASNVTISGTLIIDQNLNIKNADKITLSYDAGIKANPPPFFSGYTPGISVTPNKDWHEIVPAI